MLFDTQYSKNTIKLHNKIIKNQVTRFHQKRLYTKQVQHNNEKNEIIKLK